MTALEQAFQKEILRKCEIAKTECGYNPVRFLQMVAAKGAVVCAKQLLSRKNISDGFTTLQMAGRLDLSLEATVADSRYGALFSDDEVNHCYDLLCECGYYGV